MSRDVSGNYTLPAGNPVVGGTVIATTWANPTLSDVAQALTESLDRNGRGGMLAGLRLLDGTAALPGLSFSSEANTGIYRISAGIMGLSVLGTEAARFSAAQFSTVLGSATVPPHTFTGDLNTGIYSPGADQVAVTTGGTQRILVSAAGVVTFQPPSSGYGVVLGSTNAANVGGLSIGGAGTGIQGSSVSFQNTSAALYWVGASTSGKLNIGGIGATAPTVGAIEINNLGNIVMNLPTVPTGVVPTLEVIGNAGAETLKLTVANNDVLLNMSSAGGTGREYSIRSNNSGEFVIRDTTATANRLVLTGDGRFYGTALHNNAGAVTGTTTQYIASGTYTVVPTNVANATSLTNGSGQWIRVGNVVTLSGNFAMGQTSASTSTSVSLSIPIASTFAAAADAVGIAYRRDATIAGLGGTLNVSAGVPLLTFVSDGTTSSRTWAFCLAYTVL